MVIAGLCEKDYTSIRICDLKFLTSYEKHLQKCSYLSIYEVMNGQRVEYLEIVMMHHYHHDSQNQQNPHPNLTTTSTTKILETHTQGGKINHRNQTHKIQPQPK